MSLTSFVKEREIQIRKNFWIVHIFHTGFLAFKKVPFPFQVEPIPCGYRQYACPYCPKIMETPSLMKTHIRIHTGEKPYKCPYCTNSFTQKGNCEAHIKSVHKNYIIQYSSSWKQKKIDNYFYQNSCNKLPIVPYIYQLSR